MHLALRERVGELAALGLLPASIFCLLLRSHELLSVEHLLHPRCHEREAPKIQLVHEVWFQTDAPAPTPSYPSQPQFIGCLIQFVATLAVEQIRPDCYLGHKGLLAEYIYTLWQTQSRCYISAWGVWGGGNCQHITPFKISIMVE